MKIVKVKGGLGNQLFQYSFALLLQKITNDIVKLDLTSFNFSQSDSIRKPRLLKFQIPLQIATNEEIKQFCILNHSDRMTTNKYRLKIIFEAIFNKKYYFDAPLIKISDFIFNKKVKITSNGALYLDGSKHFSYDAKIKNYIFPFQRR